jgi:hypothetical protein
MTSSVATKAHLRIFSDCDVSEVVMSGDQVEAGVTEGTLAVASAFIGCFEDAVWVVVH